MQLCEEESGLKARVRAFWDAESCGEVYAGGQSVMEFCESERASRYQFEPYIPAFARFQEGKDKDVLGIGLGMGADHAEWARSGPRSLTGIDLTPRAIEHARRRLGVHRSTSELHVADAEELPFGDGSFDLVYSWGVLHHSPNTRKAVCEVHRVLRANGVARIMLYHAYSLTGYLLWTRYGLFAGRPNHGLFLLIEARK